MWDEPGRAFRTFLIPATIVNQKGRVRLIDHDAHPLTAGVICLRAPDGTPTCSIPQQYRHHSLTGFE